MGIWGGGQPSAAWKQKASCVHIICSKSNIFSVGYSRLDLVSKLEWFAANRTRMSTSQSRGHDSPQVKVNCIKCNMLVLISEGKMKCDTNEQVMYVKLSVRQSIYRATLTVSSALGSD